MDIVLKPTHPFYCLVIVIILLLQACGSTQKNDSAGKEVYENTLLSKPLPASVKSDIKKDKIEVAKSDLKTTDEPLSFTGDYAQNSNENVLPQRIALMPFSNTEVGDEDITSMLHQSIFSHLSSTNYTLVRPQELEQRIQLIDTSNGFTTSDAPMLTSLLDTDAILLSKIISSDVTYVAIVSQIYFEVELSLVDKTGKIIWSEVFSERSLEGGFAIDPFSMLYKLAVTAMHLGKENMFAVADKIGRQIAGAIPQPQGSFSAGNLLIDSVIHNGANKSLKFGDILKVGVKAPANMSVTVAIETISELFTAKQSNPGTYFVDIPVNSNWNGDNLLLTAYILDNMGNRARKISHVSLLNFDNEAPVPVKDLSAKLFADSASLTWQHANNDLHYSVYELVDEERKLLEETTNKAISINKAHTGFEYYEFAVVARDKAGNVSSELKIITQYLPFNALKQSTIISKSKLPIRINEDSRLTKEHSPYLVANISSVSADAILFIEPGVVLEFTQTGSLNIQGSLQTFGLSPVLFRSVNDRQQDQSFIIIDTLRHVELKGFAIVNAGIGIEVLNGKPTLENCEITNSNYSALSISNTANVDAKNCKISGSNTSAIVVTNNARLHIENTEFTNNFPFHIQNSSTYVVDARNNQWQPAADAFTILGNVKY